MANEYLKRVNTSGGNRRVFTWAGWVKRSNITQSLTGALFSGANPVFNTPSQQEISFFIGTGDDFNVYFGTSGVVQDGVIITTQKFRDCGNWFHLIVSIDSTKVNSTDRVRIYLNGSLITDFSSISYPSRNYEFALNRSGFTINVGGTSTTGNQWLGEFADIFFIDGQALTPDVFGFYKVGKGYISVGSTQATDFRPGQWVPKTPRVIKTAINNNGGFGVNGFYLPMNDSNNFGADFHCDPNSIIKLQENLPQPKCRIDGVEDYTGALRADPYAANLVLALPFVSGGLQNGFGDYSAAIKGSGSAKTLTLNGGVGIANTASYYGSTVFFDGVDDHITTDVNSDLQLGSGNFTIESWINYKSGNGGDTPFTLDSPTTTYAPLIGYLNGNLGTPLLYLSSAGSSWDVANGVGFGPVVSINQWTHLAVSRQGTYIKLFRDGVGVGIITDVGTKSIYQSSNQLSIGRVQGTVYFDGYLQDLRIYKGVAKYTGGFDVPRPYTPVGIATWRAVPDTTANNFATLNPLVPSSFSSGDRSISNGNLTVTTIYSGNGTNARSTIGVSTGKWYAETYLSGDTNGGGGFIAVFGIGRTDNQTNASSGDHINYYGSNGQKYDYDNGTPTTSSYGSTYTTGDIIGITVNADNGQVAFYKNGVSQGVAKTFTTSQYPLFFQMEDGASVATVTFNTNFGQNPTFSGNTTAGTYADTNGKGLFKYQPPSGFLALCEDNLPTPAIANPGRHFKTVLWTGDGNNGRSIVGVGFTPDLVWIKCRSVAYNHRAFDSVRGAGKDNFLLPSSTAAEGASSDYYGGISSFNTDGFSMVYGTGGSNIGINESGSTFVAWCWRAGAGTTSTNTNGSITSVVSVNQDAGFSIVSYTGNGVDGATIGHGLGKSPAFIIAKGRDNAVNWPVYHKSTTASNFLYLNSTSASLATSAMWNSNPSSSVFYVGNQAQNNTNALRYIAYCWAEIEGYSKFGSYVGNGSADGPFVYCGFKPAFVLVKKSSAAGSYWMILDSSRDSSNPAQKQLYPNTNDIEGAGSGDIATWDFISNGFKLRYTGGNANSSGETMIFAAFAESPFAYSNSK
jgi:hypothetical protein